MNLLSIPSIWGGGYSSFVGGDEWDLLFHCQVVIHYEMLRTERRRTSENTRRTLLKRNPLGTQEPAAGE